MCLVCLDLVNLPLFSKSMELLLSCISLLCVILYPCDSMKYPVYSIMDMPLSTPIISSSTEIFPFIFCFMEKLYTTPLNGDIMPPVCPRKSSCTTYEASTHHLTTGMSPTLKTSLSLLGTLRYFNTSFISPQLSSSGFFMRTVRNITAICMCWSAMELMNISCATVR